MEKRKITLRAKHVFQTSSKDILKPEIIYQAIKAEASVFPGTSFMCSLLESV